MEKGESRVQQLQEGVEEVRVIMEDNITQAREREGKLEELDERAGLLSKSSQRFQRSTGRVRQQMETENARVPFNNWKRFATIIGVVLTVIVIVGVIIWYRLR
ncbi:uncharacterized protein LOC128317021 [Pangasianodon hypophthalmus]|uniref:uncharacterized protein LOC128317021 n=1 Tax=Pangasianodon hypophthalmus TaxID=310915 RepID=UPI00148189A1|nr:uncharacterized protein LOC128317021 [Pangasianodon hypophthalmus]